MKGNLRITLHVRLLVRRLGIVQLQNVADGETGRSRRHLHVLQQSATESSIRMYSIILWNCIIIIITLQSNLGATLD